MISAKQKQDLLRTIRVVLENGDRLAQDAEHLFEYDRSPSAFALAVLAQEEYAKAFFLHLVYAEAIPWSNDILQTLRDHASKQLLALVMQFLDPDDDIVVWLKSRSESGNKLTPDVADALNIIRHERIPRQGPWAWTGGDVDPPCDRNARRIADGLIDRKKQSAFYVGVGPQFEVTSNPTKLDCHSVEAELEKTKRLGQLLARYDDRLEPLKSVEYEKICWSFRVMFGLCTVDDYNRNWWAWNAPF
ncbi:MAG: AbiV family abortive infection protein [Pyrinomonadaceae bacterium]